jgi:hypothetical protein
MMRKQELQSEVSYCFFVAKDGWSLFGENGKLEAVVVLHKYSFLCPKHSLSMNVTFLAAHGI